MYTRHDSFDELLLITAHPADGVGCMSQILHHNIYFAIVISSNMHGLLHRLFIYDFRNGQMVQSDDEIIYISRHPDEIIVCTNVLITLFSYQKHPRTS